MPPQKRKADDVGESASRAKRPATTAAKKATPAKTTTATKKTAVVKKTTATKKTAAVKEAAPARKIASAKGSKKTATPARVVAPKKAVATKAAAAPKKVAAAPKPAPEPKAHKFGATINDAPTQRLDVFVMGEGGNSELGLGARIIDGKQPMEVKRPRLNHNLDAKEVGVIALACADMHAIALTHDNQILTWGQNDGHGLGRDTTQEIKFKDEDGTAIPYDEDGKIEEDEDSGLAPIEATPTAIPGGWYPEGTKFTAVCASENATFVLTQDGSVYGWGVFRDNDKSIGFDEKTLVQETPKLVPGLKKIIALAGGGNHMLALDKDGHVWVWGTGQSHQLGRRIVERTALSALSPYKLGLKDIVSIGAGEFHSFAVNKDGEVYTWGLNNFGQTGIDQGAGEGDNAILSATIVNSLKDYKIKQVTGGMHHSYALTDDGKVLAFGRCDAHQLGLDVDDLPEDSVVRDEQGARRIVKKPTEIPDLAACKWIASKGMTGIAITEEGEAYAWGSSATYQTGTGTDDDVEEPTHIDNTAVRGKQLYWAGLGSQFGILAAPVDI